MLTNPSEIILFCAFRYALGRHTYVVGEVVEYLIKNSQSLSNEEKQQYVKEIKGYLLKNSGMEMDNQYWRRILHLFDESFHCKILSSFDNKIYSAVEMDGRFYALTMDKYYYPATKI